MLSELFNSISSLFPPNLLGYTNQCGVCNWKEHYAILELRAGQLCSLHHQGHTYYEYSQSWHIYFTFLLSAHTELHVSSEAQLPLGKRVYSLWKSGKNRIHSFLDISALKLLAYSQYFLVKTCQILGSSGDTVALRDLRNMRANPSMCSNIEHTGERPKGCMINILFHPQM